MINLNFGMFNSFTRETFKNYVSTWYFYGLPWTGFTFFLRMTINTVVSPKLAPQNRLLSWHLRCDFSSIHLPSWHPSGRHTKLGLNRFFFRKKDIFALRFSSIF